MTSFVSANPGTGVDAHAVDAEHADEEHKGDEAVDSAAGPKSETSKKKTLKGNPADPMGEEPETCSLNGGCGGGSDSTRMDTGGNGSVRNRLERVGSNSGEVHRIGAGEHSREFSTAEMKENRRRASRDHKRGDEAEITGVDQSSGERLDKFEEWARNSKWGPYNSAHDRIHIFRDRMRESGATQPQIRAATQQLRTGVSGLLNAGLRYVEEVGSGKLSAAERKERAAAINQEMEKAEQILNQVDFKQGGADNAHEWLMTRLNDDNQQSSIARMMGSIEDTATGKPGSHWSSMVDNNPTNPSNHNGAGQAWLDLNKPDKALANFNQAAQLDPGNATAQVGLATAYFQQKDYAAAAAAAQRALDIDPSNEAARMALMMSQGRGGGSAGGAGSASAASAGAAGGPGSYEDAHAHHRAPSIAMSDPKAQQSYSLSQKGSSAFQMREYGEAIRYANRALELDPNNAHAYYLRSAAYLKQKEYERALQDAVAGNKIAPRNNLLLNSKAKAQNAMKQWTGALEAANSALEIDPNNAYSHFMRANALFGMGKHEEGLAALRRAAQLDAQYQTILDEALKQPEGSDLTFLFTDDLLAGGASKTASAPGRGRRFSTIMITSLLGGGLVGLGLLHLLLPSLAAGVKSAFTKRSTIADEDKTVSVHLPTPAPLGQAGRINLLKGQFKIVKQIGQGGMGTVYEGLDVSLERRVAIKKMKDELRVDRRERERFLTEAKLAAALHHPNCVDIYAIVEENDELCLVFEYVDGKTIHELVYGKGRLTLAEALPLLKGVAAALDAAHSRGIIHRDLKPSNVMVDADGRAKVMDFGIARAAKDAMNKVSMTNTVVGTPPYMAPEQEQGVVRRESDVYALGVCLYEMLTGRLPFVGSGAGMLMNKLNKSFAPASTLAPELPDSVDRVIARVLDPDPDKRYKSAGELVADLDAASRPVG